MIIIYLIRRQEEGARNPFIGRHFSFGVPAFQGRGGGVFATRLARCRARGSPPAALAPPPSSPNLLENKTEKILEIVRA